ncbi:hypothetical protein AXF42_Ash008885 [Apostasia shenzhenica]|uniref:Uncharacterized protein n=1 Tax=Apostasia shenzhenica TaxID=1088818 RepID=A0A2I0ASR9_9ASPA|nr:hypothetical protein AXF42_Ash008885 [Apostasia shenzhenica]
MPRATLSPASFVNLASGLFRLFHQRPRLSCNRPRRATACHVVLQHATSCCSAPRRALTDRKPSPCSACLALFVKSKTLPALSSLSAAASPSVAPRPGSQRSLLASSPPASTHGQQRERT